MRKSHEFLNDLAINQARSRLENRFQLQNNAAFSLALRRSVAVFAVAFGVGFLTNSLLFFVGIRERFSNEFSLCELGIWTPRSIFMLAHPLLNIFSYKPLRNQMKKYFNRERVQVLNLQLLISQLIPALLKAIADFNF